jgi:membrane protein implicated in regulation of membrane protease activity
MVDHWVWWLLAALLVGLELATGTFYLLAVGAAFAVGGLAAWLGASLPAQLATGGIVGVVAVVIAHQWRRRRATPAAMPGLDRGHPVHVDRWNADGTARVVYRGTQWDAELATPDVRRGRTMYIVATRGSTLVLSDRRP